MPCFAANSLGLQRGKKRRWKEAYHTASDEVAALHTQLLAKHKDLEVLEGHLNQLQTELAMLGINMGAGLNMAGLRPLSASSGDYGSRHGSPMLLVLSPQPTN